MKHPERISLIDTRARMLSNPHPSHKDGLNLIGPGLFVLAWLALFCLGFMVAL